MPRGQAADMTSVSTGTRRVLRSAPQGMRRAMAKKTKNQRMKLVLRRVLEDEEVQGHLRTTATRVDEAWRRASSKRPSRAVEDKKLYAKIREAAIALKDAIRTAVRPPEKPKHRGRKVVLAAAGAGGAAYAVKKLQENASSG